MILVVDVGVSLSRPPKLDRISRIVLSVDTPDDGSRLGSSESDGLLSAVQMVMRGGVVMPVSAKIVEVLEI